VIVERLELVDFRNYASAKFELTDGMTVVMGDNGHGKTNLAEALAYLATLSSFRATNNEAMIREGADRAVVRAVVRQPDERRESIDAELPRRGVGRAFVNRQRLRKVRDLLGTVRVTVFSPDDLVIVKGSPGGRRRYLDETLSTLSRKHDAARLDIDRLLRQRNTLLKQLGSRWAPASQVGSRGGDDDATLDIWDQRFSDAGDQFGATRAALVEQLTPLVGAAYGELAGDTSVRLSYDPPWRRTGLAAALAAARDDDLRLRTSTVGPHRDDVDLFLNDLPARTHASQGEQRSLALALRLATHRLVVAETGDEPVLVLDDVLSELDDGRSASLLAHLHGGQIVITTASAMPPGAHPDAVIRIENGTRVEVSGGKAT